MSLIHTQNELALFLNETLGLTGFTLSPLRVEVSSRDYYRVSFTDNDHTQALHKNKIFNHFSYTLEPDLNSFVISLNHQKIAEEDDFCTVQNDFKNSAIPVPEIYRLDPDHGLIWQEDLGDQDLRDYIENQGSYFSLQHDKPFEKTVTPPKLSGEVKEYYKQAIRYLVRLKDLTPKEPIKNRFFNEEKLFAELSYLAANANECLPAPTQKEFSLNELLENEWRSLCEELDFFKEERICHRDYHSGNLKIKNGNLYWIDFQDARMGSRYYDLASLLYDPYVALDGTFRDDLFHYYHNKSAEKADLQAFRGVAIQRLLKALGTYIHQVFSKKNVSFSGYIITALDRLGGLLAEYERLPQTHKWLKRFKEDMTKIFLSKNFALTQEKT